jgi:hypothetical protein
MYWSSIGLLHGLHKCSEGDEKIRTQYTYKEAFNEELQMDEGEQNSRSVNSKVSGFRLKANIVRNQTAAN